MPPGRRLQLERPVGGLTAALGIVVPLWAREGLLRAGRLPEPEVLRLSQRLPWRRAEPVALLSLAPLVPTLELAEGLPRRRAGPIHQLRSPLQLVVGRPVLHLRPGHLTPLLAAVREQEGERDSTLLKKVLRGKPIRVLSSSSQNGSKNVYSNVSNSDPNINDRSYDVYQTAQRGCRNRSSRTLSGRRNARRA